MNSRGGKLVRNTIVLAIGNIGSRIIKFFLLPLYAIFLSKQDVGLYDIIFTSILLIEPVATLKIADAVYRRLVSNDEHDSTLVWTGAEFSFFCALLVTVLFLVFVPSSLFKYKWEAAAFFLAKVFYGYFSEVVRGYRQNAQYASGGVILTFITLSMSLVVLYSPWPEKLSGLILAAAFAHFVVGFYFAWRSNIKERGPVLATALLAPLLAYSIPLIPSAVSWWAMRLSNRFFITAKLGLEQNANIAIAMTIPSVVVVLGQIFYMAWQESSFRNIEAEDRDKFFSVIYDRYINLQLFLCTACFLASELTYRIFFPASYYDSWQLSYFFFWGAIFNNLSAFLSVGYTGTYHTGGAFYTSIFGAIANVVSTWLLLPAIGVWAAPVGFFIGLFLMWVVRSIHTRKYFNIRIDWKSISPSVFALAVAGIYLFLDNVGAKVVVSLLALGISVWGNAPLLIESFRKIRSRINVP